MLKRLWRSMLMVTAIASASTPVFAQGYLGVGLGANFFRDAEYVGIEDESTSFEVKGGVRLAEVLALEMSYLNLGEFRDLVVDTDVGYSGVTVSGKAILPVGDQMDVYAKIGMYFWELDEKYRRQTYALDEGEDLIFGGGVAFYIADGLSVDLEYRMMELPFDVYDVETDLFTAGITFSF